MDQLVQLKNSGINYRFSTISKKHKKVPNQISSCGKCEAQERAEKLCEAQSASVYGFVQ